MEIYTPVSEARERKAFNLHISAEKHPIVRVNGDIERLGRRIEGTLFQDFYQGQISVACLGSNGLENRNQSP